MICGRTVKGDEMLRREMEEIITAVEKCAAKGGNPKLSQHRWGQALRMLKFYQLRRDTIVNDPAWQWPQNHPISPYYIKGVDYSYLVEHYRKHPDLRVEPTAKEIEDARKAGVGTNN